HSITFEIPNVIVVDFDNLIHYHFTSNNLILDVYPGTYDQHLYKAINNIYYGTVWGLFENAIPTVLENVKDRIQGGVKIVDLKEKELSKMYAADNIIYLVDMDLDDKRESELYKYYTGVPFKKENGSYSNFIPVFQQNSEIELCITPKDKYKLLASRYFFYKKKRNSNKGEFIKSKTRESYLYIKNFLEEKRLDIIEKIVKDNDHNNFFIFKTNIDERFENFAIRLGISVASGTASIDNYRFGLKNALASNQIEGVCDFTDYVILGNLGPTTTTIIKEISYKFACPIIVPYYRGTRDITIINRIKEVFKTQKVSSIEKFRRNRVVE
ncbi:MAG: hypothetical protein ACOC3V_01170, partial [bacterium]